MEGNRKTSFAMSAITYSALVYSLYLAAVTATVLSTNSGTHQQDVAQSCAELYDAQLYSTRERQTNSQSCKESFTQEVLTNKAPPDVISQLHHLAQSSLYPTTTLHF